MKWCELREYKWNEYVTASQLNRNLSNCEVARKKEEVFRGFNGILIRGLCVRAAELYQPSYDDLYTGGRPIYWVHQPEKGMKHRMKWWELRQYKWNEYVTIAVELQCNHIQTGRKGRGGVPAATLEVDNFFNVKANATKLGDFF